jgi:glucose dehydrogenase
MHKSVMLAGIALVAISAGAGQAANRSSLHGTSLAQLFPAVGSDWTASEGDVSSQRFSSLSQINTSNVSKLKMVWSASVYPPAGSNYASLGVESAPIEAAGVMYVPSTDGVDALNATSGKPMWAYHGIANKSSGLFNLLAARTLSMGGGLVYAGQADGSIVALNQKTGAPVWTAQVASVGTYGSSTAAISNPATVYYNGMVLAGVNGGDSPLRGHLDAYDAKTGALIWRFFTLPDQGEFPFILSWSNPAEAATGGAAIWSIPAVDPVLNRVYVGTGNAYPYTGRAPGKSLWANSEVSLDLKTGQLKWFYQAVHHDEWDYDCPTPPVLFNTTVNGKSVPAMAFSCKSGYVYELSRRNGHPIFPIPEVPVPNLDNGAGAALNNTWPTQPEPTGGAAQILPHCPTAAQVSNVLPGYPTPPNGTSYVLTCPYAPTDATHYTVWGPYFAFGGTDYPPMSYSPVTNDLYVCANVTWQSQENVSPTSQSTQYLTGGGWTTVGESGTVTALNMSTNKIDWQKQYQANQDGACYSGVLSTAGGLVFTASRGQTDTTPGFGGTFYAYDAKTGKQLFSYKNSSLIMAPPLTYSVNGKQYVAVDMTAGTNHVIFPGFGGITTSTSDKLVVFALP